MSVSIEFLEVGRTHHWLKMVSNKSPAIKVPFPATVALLQHEKFGPILFDTGYSPRFHEVTKKFPEKLYSLITPVEIGEQETLVKQLEKRGINAADIQFIILSHFHADHIGGISDFSKANYIYLKHAYEPLKNLGRFRSVLFNGFLKNLLPTDFIERSSPFSITAGNCSNLHYDSFNQAYDLFGDGSILAIELPGHAPGHLGLLVYADKGTYFLVGDACWVRENFISNSQPQWITRKLVLDDAKQYEDTLQKLKKFHVQYPEVHIVPCHCNKSHARLRSQQQTSENIQC